MRRRSYSKSERLLPYEGVGYFRAHLPPSAEGVEVDGFGHSPQLERPRELCARIIDFLDWRLPRTGPGALPRPATVREWRGRAAAVTPRA